MITLHFSCNLSWIVLYMSLTQECSWSLNIQIWLLDRNVVPGPKTMNPRTCPAWQNHSRPVQLNGIRGVILMDESLKGMLNLVHHVLIYHVCFRAIYIEEGLWQSSECIETKPWPLQEMSSKLVKTWVWGYPSTALFFCFYCLKMFTFSVSTLCVHIQTFFLRCLHGMLICFHLL